MSSFFAAIPTPHDNIQMQFFPLTYLGLITATLADARGVLRTRTSTNSMRVTVSPCAFVVQRHLPSSVSSIRRTDIRMPNPTFGSVGTIWANRADQNVVHPNDGSMEYDKDIASPAPPRIAIIGGGIAGVTAARSIAKQLAINKGSLIKRADIVIYEGDDNGGPQQEPFDIQRQTQPTWGAATAKNANSIVPGVAMHVMSQRSTLMEIAKDTINEWLMLKLEGLKEFISEGLVPIKKIDDFSVIPPYFSFHPLKCLGPTATMEERWTFLTFLRHFVSTSLLSGEKEAHDRGLFVFQLAKANRMALLSDTLNEAPNERKGMTLQDKIGLGTGFMSLHRTEAKAKNAVREALLEHGEAAEALTWEQATELEPRIKNLPIDELHAVHRPSDNTANCATYIREMIHQCEEMGVDYVRGEGSRVLDIKRLPSSLQSSTSENKPTYRIIKADGSSDDYDCIVLAAGIRTPLLARKLGIGKYCPTYPLRGFSLTLYTDTKSEAEMKALKDQGKSVNLLNKPISIDAMYCSSVGPNMARIAGFGELVGYGDKVKDVPSVGPRVMTRYVRSIFPDARIKDDQAIQCFRPLSPDDLPLVGEVENNPGLFLHTGHGTLGWTMSLATGECIAQAVRDRIENIPAGSHFVLHDGSLLKRDVLSPNRFAKGIFDQVSGNITEEKEVPGGNIPHHTHGTTMAEPSSRTSPNH